jgi:hypothetical protein
MEGQVRRHGGQVRGPGVQVAGHGGAGMVRKEECMERQMRMHGGAGEEAWRAGGADSRTMDMDVGMG